MRSIFFLLIIMITPIVYGDLAVIVRNGVDVNESLNLVKQIPPIFLVGLDVIEFSNNIHEKACGHYWISWHTMYGIMDRIIKTHVVIYNNEVCYYKGLFLLKIDILWHEVGHHNEGLTQGVNLSEEFASNFRENYLKNI